MLLRRTSGIPCLEQSSSKLACIPLLPLKAILSHGCQNGSMLWFNVFQETQTRTHTIFIRLKSAKPPPENSRSTRKYHIRMSSGPFYRGLADVDESVRKSNAALTPWMPHYGRLDVASVKPSVERPLDIRLWYFRVWPEGSEFETALLGNFAVFSSHAHARLTKITCWTQAKWTRTHIKKTTHTHKLRYERKSRMKPGKEPHAAQELRVGHPCSILLYSIPRMASILKNTSMVDWPSSCLFNYPVATSDDKTALCIMTHFKNPAPRQWKQKLGVKARPISCLNPQLPFPRCPLVCFTPLFYFLQAVIFLCLLQLSSLQLILRSAPEPFSVTNNERLCAPAVCSYILREHMSTLSHRGMNNTSSYCIMHKSSCICEQSWVRGNRSEQSRLCNCSHQQLVILILSSYCFNILNRNITSTFPCRGKNTV